MWCRLLLLFFFFLHFITYIYQQNTIYFKCPLHLMRWRSTKTVFTADTKMKHTSRPLWESLQAYCSTISAGSFFELPLLSAHGALLLDLLWVQPFQDAMHVETMGALTPDQRAVIPRHFACKTSLILQFILKSGWCVSHVLFQFSLRDTE